MCAQGGEDRPRPRRARRLALLVAVGLLLQAGPAAATRPIAPAPGAGDPVGVPALPTGGGRVLIVRDGYGVPHVFGETPEAMAFGAGYAVASDRLFQADLIRRIAQGRLAEVLGEEALEADRVIRREFYDREDVQRQYRALPTEVRRLLVAYADGFNAALAAQQANPAERSVAFTALGYEPEPWRPEDSLAVLMLFTMVAFAGEGEGGELENAALLARLASGRPLADALAIWNDLLLPNDPDAPAAVPPGEGPPPPPGGLAATRPHPAQVALALQPGLAGARQAAARQRAVLRWLLDRLPVPRVGSYGLVATGRRTAHGRGLLLGSPQAGFYAPPIFYELGLHAPGLDCAGMTVPGLGPVVGIGWCNGHAWTLVAGNAGDQVDLYVETLHPQDPYRYLYRGEWRPMAVRREVYLVRSTLAGQPPRVVVEEIRSTVHGPVFHLDPAGRRAFVYRRAQRGHFARTLLGLLALNRGRSFAEVEEGLRHITATYNLLYADADGTIAYRLTGWQPVRHPGVDLRLPVPGTGEFEWRSPALPFERMPHVTRPRGDILHVNQGIDTKPIAWWPRSSAVFVGRIGHTAGDQVLMRHDRGLDLAALERRNRDLAAEVDTVTARLAPLIRRALAGVPGDSDLGRARALFEDWAAQGFRRRDADGDGRLDHPAIAVFGADYLDTPVSPLWDRFMERIWRPLAGQVPPTTYIGRLGLTLAAIERPSLFSRPYARGWEAKFRGALAETLEILARRHPGLPMERWTVPVPTHPFTAVGPVAPRPLRGPDHGSYSQLLDLGAGVGFSVLPPGNGRADRAADVARHLAGGELPRHFHDQLELYERWRFKPMRLRREDALAAAESRQELYYPGATDWR